MNKIIIAICSNCGNKYKKFEGKTSHNSKELSHYGIRGCNTVTCSKECSKRFNRRKRLKNE